MLHINFIAVFQIRYFLVSFWLLALPGKVSMITPRSSKLLRNNKQHDDTRIALNNPYENPFIRN